MHIFEAEPEYAKGLLLRSACMRWNVKVRSGGKKVHKSRVHVANGRARGAN